MCNGIKIIYFISGKADSDHIDLKVLANFAKLQQQSIVLSKQT